MQSNINSTVYNPQNLGWVSSVELGKPENELDVKFSPDNQWKDTDGWWGHPDEIHVQFKGDAKEKSKKLEEKIKSLNKDIFVYTTDTYEVEVRAKDAKALFKAIQLMQVEDSKLFIPKTLLQKTLSHLNDSSLDEIRPKIRTRLTSDVYQNTMQMLNTAISSLNKNLYVTATKCLCHAKLLCQQNLKDFNFDLDQFFQSMGKVECLDVFNPEFDFDDEIIDAIVDCKNITFLGLDDSVCNLETATRLGNFLEKTKYVTYVNIGGMKVNGGPINESTIGLFTKALKTNKSIQKLYIGRNKIGDTGAQILMDAIEENPNSNINLLYLNQCNITERFRDTLEIFCKGKKIELSFGS